MSARVLLRDQPQRAIALVTQSHALLFRHSTGVQSDSSQSVNTLGQTGSPAGPRCIVELVPTEQVASTSFRSLSRSIHGCLGLITIGNDVFLCVVSGASKVATLRPGETVQRILSVEFFCLNRSDYDHILNDEINQYQTETLDEEGYETGLGQGRQNPALEHPCMALRKLLSGGSFYYSSDFDSTSRLQDRSSVGDFDFDMFDKGYLWNGYMIRPLMDFRSRLSDRERDALDATRLLTAAIRGFALTMTVPAPAAPARRSKSGMPSTLTLISRLSCNRAGTRFNARGIDDDGNVANFVETETIFWNPEGICLSYVQVRGSVPLFWEQSAGLLPGQQKVQLTRSPQATQPAFDKHFEGLEMKYGPIHVVNLLSNERQGEIEISQRYRNHVMHSSLNIDRDGKNALEHGLIRETDYDFHAETRAGGYEAASGIRRYIHDSAESFIYCLLEETEEETGKAGMKPDSQSRPWTVILQQEGVFRTNCLDCLDRTNLMQTIISQMAIEAFLGPRGEHATGDFLARHGSLWADNGDALSKIYAGTGALKSSFTRSGKMSIAGALADARKSAARMYINNFADKGRQNVMDMLLGRLLGQTPVYLFDPINDYVTAELSRRSIEYSSARDIKIWAGTFNLNGRSNGLQDDLSSWLCPDVDQSQQNPEIVAVGFQEIVELSPQQIMSTEPTMRQAWEKAVKRTLNDNARAYGSEDYVLLRGGQLVGASLSIFVKKSLLGHIKNVEGSLKKTGMSGMAGNKGAVGIRLDIDNTSFCFVTAHLAAGFANYEERNRDYHTISHGLRFQRNRSIDEHDTVIWLGDFNYRIGLSVEKARHYAKTEDFERLYENDQLNLQMVAGLTFPHYSEARILFRPTYKFDLGTDEYDTSEKARIPAWTDRILRKGTNIRQINYDSAPLRFSDHRPVYATFSCTISVVDEAQKNAISKEIYAQRRAAPRDTAAHRGNLLGGSDDEDLAGFEPIAAGLPPASSNQGKKWWLDNGLHNGMPARSTLLPPSTDHVPNPNRPDNPFTPSPQPEWVTRSDAGTTNGGRSASANRNDTQSSSKLPASTVQQQRPAPNLPYRDTRPGSSSSAAGNGSMTPRDSARSASGMSSISTDSNGTVVHHDMGRTNSTALPPLVPRKPIALSSTPTSNPPTTQPGPGSQSSRTSTPTANPQSQGGPPQPPLPRRSGASSGKQAAQQQQQPRRERSLLDDDDVRQGWEDGAPQLPTRQGEPRSSEDDALSGWAVLRPS